MCFSLMLLVKKKKKNSFEFSSVFKICFINGAVSFIGWSSKPRSGKFIKEGSQENVPLTPPLSPEYDVLYPGCYCR